MQTELLGMGSLWPALAGLLAGLLVAAGFAIQAARRGARLALQSHALEDAHARLEAQSEELDQLRRQNAALDRDLAQLQAIHSEKIAGFQALEANLQESRRQLKMEFEQLAHQVLEQQGIALATRSERSLDGVVKPLREQLDRFQARVNEVHDASLRGNVMLSEEIRRVAEAGLKIGVEAQALATALKGNKKTTGLWGEMQLERSLQAAGLVRGEHYDAQPRYVDTAGQARQPDFVVKLPDDKHIVIDSKVSLVDYERAVTAAEETEHAQALAAHVKAVRQHIDDLSRKDYSNLVAMRSPNFVLMFMPIEPAYIEALRQDPTLFDYGYQRNVVLVSPTTLLPVLKTIANIWMLARSNEEAHELSSRAGEIYNQVVLMAERLKKLGSTLETTSRHYNDTVTALAGQQGLYGKVSRFNTLSAKANKKMPALEPLNADFHTERLILMADGNGDLQETL